MQHLTTPQRSIKRSEIVTTVVRSDKEAIQAIQAIQRLNLDGRRFHLDPTYSKGVFWKGLEGPAIKSDMYPQAAGVNKWDARKLPLEDWSIDSIMFDPPFIAKNVTDRTPNGKIEKRFGGYPTIDALWAMYTDCLVEFRRLLRPQGILVFKCQDVVSGGKQYFSHCEIWDTAKGLGYSAKDLYIRYNPNIMVSPNMSNQKHARRTHCYFWVFER